MKATPAPVSLLLLRLRRWHALVRLLLLPVALGLLDVLTEPLGPLLDLLDASLGGFPRSAAG
jgi:hypothetical protein